MARLLGALSTFILASALFVSSPASAESPVDLDPLLNLSASGNVYDMAETGDGGLIIVGDFTSVGGTTRNRIARINADGSLDPTFNPNVNGTLYSVAVSGNTVFVGGSFTSVGGVSRNHVAALDLATGSPTAWSPSLNGTAYALAVTATTVVIGGSFTVVGGVTRNRVAEVSRATGMPTTWNPNANNTVNTIAMTATTVVIGGSFTSVRGVARNRAAELDLATGSVTSFDPDTSGTVNNIVLGPDGSLIIAGSFSTISGVNQRFLARFDSNRNFDNTFDPTIDAQVSTIAHQPDGKIVIGGSFTSVDGAPRGRLARLNADGSLDTGFADPVVSGPGSKVLATLIRADGKITAGGIFTSVGGTARGSLAQFRGGEPPPAPTPAPPVIVPAWRSTLDPSGGVCVDGVDRSQSWSTTFLGYRYLPGPDDCRRMSFEFAGWAEPSSPYESRPLPLLVDPSDGHRRYFVAENVELIAVWTSLPKLPTTFASLNDFFCPGCHDQWFVWDTPIDDSSVTITDPTGKVVCATNSISIGGWNLCHEATRISGTYSLISRRGSTVSTPLTITV